MSEYVVTADGAEVGRFDELEDAENMASAWNSAYPHEPWFVVGPVAEPVEVSP